MIEQESTLGRRGHKAAIAVTAVLSLLPGAFILGTATNASAGTGLASIVCGGQKIGSGWQTYPTGGYVGEGCGAGIDYVATPTQSDSYYDFGVTDGGSYPFQAWIPDNHATANMDFSIYADCGSKWALLADKTVNEAPLSDVWVTLGTVSGWTGCDIKVQAWTGMASSGYYMGLDAIRSHT